MPKDDDKGPEEDPFKITLSNKPDDYTNPDILSSYIKPKSFIGEIIFYQDNPRKSEIPPAAKPTAFARTPTFQELATIRARELGSLGHMPPIEINFDFQSSRPYESYLVNIIQGGNEETPDPYTGLTAISVPPRLSLLRQSLIEAYVTGLDDFFRARHVQREGLELIATYGSPDVPTALANTMSLSGFCRGINLLPPGVERSAQWDYTPLSKYALPKSSSENADPAVVNGFKLGFCIGVLRRYNEILASSEIPTDNSSYHMLISGLRGLGLETPAALGVRFSESDQECYNAGLRLREPEAQKTNVSLFSLQELPLKKQSGPVIDFIQDSHPPKDRNLLPKYIDNPSDKYHGKNPFDTPLF